MLKRCAPLFVPCLLIAGCGDNLHPSSDDGIAIATGDDSYDAVNPEGARPIGVAFSHDPNECDDNSVRLTARVFYLDDGSPVEDADCQYAFEDGTQVFGCFVVHSLPTAQNVVLTARDPASGALARYEQVMQGPASFDATADLTSDGLTISWDVQTNYGGVADVGGLQVFVEPSDKLVEPLPHTSPFQGSVNVTEAGTYTVFLNAFITFAEEGGCNRWIEKTIDVAHDDHGPDCKH